MEARYSQEIDRLYLQMYPMLFEYARSSLQNDDLAEEAVQETFIVACQKPESLCSSASPEGWLVKVMRNILFNTIRTRMTEERIFLDYIAATIREVTIVPDQIGLELIYDNLSDLDEFKLLKERVLEGRSYLEMSQERGISIAACRKRLERAKRTLRKKMHIYE